MGRAEGSGLGRGPRTEACSSGWRAVGGVGWVGEVSQRGAGGRGGEVCSKETPGCSPRLTRLCSPLAEKTGKVLGEFCRCYKEQYGVALFNSVRYEIEGNGGPQAQLLHRKVRARLRVRSSISIPVSSQKLRARPLSPSHPAGVGCSPRATGPAHPRGIVHCP